MVTKLFKTRKRAEDYISESYPEVGRGHYTLESTSISDRSEWEDVDDIPNLLWSGETEALSILDENFKVIDRVAWFESGDDSYELFIGGEPSGQFDNHFDAREAFREAVEVEEEKDEDEEEVLEVRLFCNGEDISQ